MLGSLTSALPIATLCISPPESSVALLFNLGEIFNISAIFVTLESISLSGSFLRGERRGKAKLS